MDTQRLILFLVFSFSILMLWDTWERQHAPQSAPQTQAQVQDVPSAPAKAGQPGVVAPGVVTPAAESITLGTGEKIHVKTDMIDAQIDTQGGDLRHLPGHYGAQGGGEATPSPRRHPGGPRTRGRAIPEGDPPRGHHPRTAQGIRAGRRGEQGLHLRKPPQRIGLSGHQSALRMGRPGDHLAGGEFRYPKF